MTGESAMRPLALLPEILVFLGGLTALLGGSFLPRQRQWLTRLVAAAALLAALVAAAAGLSGPAESAMEGAFAVDIATGVARLVAAGSALVVLALASDDSAGSPRESETYALVLFATAGTLLLSGADDLLVLAVGFLLASIPLYGLIGLVRTPAAAEAAMKTYLLGALFGILLLAGITLLYGVAGTASYGRLPATLADAPLEVVAAGGVGVLGGLMFKAGGVPAHFWVPDAAQAAGGAVAAFLTTVPKIGAMIAAYRLVAMLPDVLGWTALVAALAVASMTLGNFAAYWQQDPRRLLGWSTVSQVGYLLVPVAVAGRTGLALPALLLYLIAYAVTNLAAFAVTAALPERRRLDQFRGLGRARPLLGGSLVVSLLGLVGTPPTLLFVGKVVISAAAWDAGHAWLAVVVFGNTLFSLFYYLRWIAPAFGAHEPPARTLSGAFAPSPWSSVAAVATATASLGLGVAAGLVWQLVS